MTQRWGHLDSIRGLAAIAVIYFHTAEYAFKRDLVSSSFEHALFQIILDWVDLGKVAVAVFFAISGFVIPFSLLKPQATPLRNFVISRFFRLYPAYWVSIPLAVVFLFILPDKPFTLPQVIANLTMLQQFLGQENLLGVYWTLQIELVFYAVSAALFAAGLLHRPRVAFFASLAFLLFALALAILRFVLEKRVPVAMPLSLSIMFWGLAWRYCLSAVENAAAQAEAKRLWQWLTGTLVVAIPVVSVLAYNVDQGYGETWYRYTLTYYVAMALFVMLTTRWRITGPIFVYLGTISYSIYLFGPIGQEIAQRLVGVENLPSLPIHLVIALAMAVTVLISAVVYAFVEAPSKMVAQRLAHTRQRLPEAI